MSPLRAMIWAAVSTAAQANEDEKYSLPSQVADGQAWCQQQGADVIDVLVVPGHSRNYRSLDALAADARAKGIDAFDRLQAHLKAGDFDLLWCRDANRFARKASLLHFIVESIVEDCGARIYSANDGWVDSTNADIFAMVKGYTTSKEMKWLRESASRGKDKLVERGLPIGSKVPLSHKRIRDEITGRDKALVVNEDLRPLWDDIAALLLEGVAWNRIGPELYRRFAHVDQSGRPYSSGTIYYLVMNPVFWGHAASRWTDDFRVGRWIFDSDCPPPDGVKLARNIVPAVYTGDQAEKVKAELRRRIDMAGRSRPGDTYRFSRLFVCGECGWSLATAVRHGKRRGLRCSAYSPVSREASPCAQRKCFNQEDIQLFLDNVLDALLRGDLPDILKQPQNESREADRLQGANKELGQVQSQIDTLIHEQSLAPEAVQPMYRERIQALAERLEILKGRTIDLKRQAATTQRQAETQKRELDEIRALSLERFWQLSDREINQHLRALFGGLRFVVRDRQAIGIIDAGER